MKPSLWLKAAAILIALNALGHTIGGIPRTAQHGAAEQALFTAMQTLHFNFMGANRSHWDFYQGFGWVISVNLAALAVLTWQVGDLSINAPRGVRPLMITLIANEALLGFLAWRYFFAVAVGFSAVTVLCVAVALAGTYRSAAQAIASGARAPA